MRSDFAGRPIWYLTVSLALFLFVSCTRCALPFVRGSGGFTVAAYNVESLFDSVDNGTEYPDFSVAAGTWSASLYDERLRNTVEAIKACAPGGPDIIALEELENPKVLADINKALKGFGYAYAAMSVSGSAVNTGILSRMPIKRAVAHSVSGAGNEEARNILEVEIDTEKGLLKIFANHWKSKLGGAEETEPRRREAASLLARRIEAVRSEEPAAYVIVLGDFNENADEWERVGGRYRTALMPAVPKDDSDRRTGRDTDALYLIGDPADFGEASPAELFEPWFGKKGEGSYSYGGTWETIDHILFSESFFAGRGMSFAAFSVIKAPFLLKEDGSPSGWDGRKRTGYSDHLPVAARIEYSAD